MILTQDDLRRLSVEEKRELARRAVLEGDVTVEGIEPGRKGYVTIAAADGSVRQVHYTKARTAYYAPGSLQTDPNRSVEYGTVPIRRETHRLPSSVWSDKKYVKRTPQQRVDSLTKRYVDTWQKYGPAFAEPLLKEIAADYWKAGTPVTADALRLVAARSLGVAEEKAKAKAAKMVTAPSYLYG